MNKILKTICLCVLPALCIGQASAGVDKLGFLAPKSDLAAQQRTLVIIESPHEYDLNPHTASYTTEAQLFTGLYEGLFSYDPATLAPLNAICKSYKVSRDKKRWTFTLQDDARFSNGEAITAQTFKDSWLELLKTPDAPFASFLDCVEGAKEYRAGGGSEKDIGISAKDDTTLVVHLTEPAEHLPSLLCHFSLAAISKDEGVYSGPFILKEYNLQKAELVKNTKYRDAKNVKLPAITILFSDDSTENSYKYNMGKADWISTNASVQYILNNDAVHISAEFGTYYLFFKMQDKKWNTSEFRRALLEAIPYDKLRDDYAVPATTLVYPLTGYPKVTGLEDYDSEDALNLMKAARKKAGIAENEQIQLIFAIGGSDMEKKQAEILKEAWEPLGVSLAIQSTPYERYNASIPSWNADLFLYSWVGDYADPLAFLELFRGDSSMNVANYKNEKYDELLLQASRASTSTEHYRLLSQAEQCLLDDGMIIPISHPITLDVIDKDSVGGWQTNALNIHPYKYLYFKPKVTKVPNIALVN